MSFVGCKLALIEGGHILTYQRDDKPGLLWPGHWDLPGGGREGSETPEDCVLRELDEEFGLSLAPARLLWRREYPSITVPASRSHFFAGRITVAEVASICFGDEGQHWQMMPVAAWLGHSQAVTELQNRTRTALTELGWPWGGSSLVERQPRFARTARAAAAGSSAAQIGRPTTM
jgi:8-oxo-dGTP diphosphatase